MLPVGLSEGRDSCQTIWDSVDAKFSQCAIPYLPIVPAVVICLITATQLLRISSVLSRYRPKWTKPFVEEEETKGDESEESSVSDVVPHSDKTKFIWSISLAVLSILSIVVQIVKLLKFSDLRLHSILLLVSWTLSGLVIALHHPRSCPTSLLAFYIPTIATEMAAVDFGNIPPTLPDQIHYVGALLAFLSVAILLAMPLHTASPQSGPISRVGTAPKIEDRTPEDSLRLWQFLTVSWVSPLIATGKARQLHNQDVWSLGFEFQTGRIARAFRELHGSVLHRLLRANAIDCCVLVLTSFIKLFCECSSPLLLHQLLLVMESPSRRTKPAMTYAILLWAMRTAQAQTSMLSLWYGRRCYERSRGELMMMIYDKVLLRKAIVGQDNQQLAETSGPFSSNGSTNPTSNIAGTSTNKTVDHQASETQTPKSSQSDQNSRGIVSKWKLFKELFTGNKQSEKQKGPASTGQVLNLLRSDAYEVSQRFLDIEKMVKLPFGIVLFTWLIWRFLGPSCVLGIIVVVISQIFNGVLARIQVRWRRVVKKATDARIQVTSQFIDTLRHLRWYSWHEKWLGKVMDARQRELNLRAISMFLNIISYFLSVLTSRAFPAVAFFAYTAIARHELSIDLIFPALQLFSYLQQRLSEIPTLVSIALNAWVSLERIQDFMNEPERNHGIDQERSDPASTFNIVSAPHTDSSTTPNSSASLVIKLDECSFAMPGLSVPVLQSINLTLEPGLTVVYGKIGTGKTAFLLGLLGELDQLSGNCQIPDESKAYCAQTPWLQSMSIRDNILFFSPYNEQRYQQVLDQCALLPDLASFKDGDLSHIGENGIGLSGGQRARVAFARALYSKSRILLLDDPLSALDHHTAESIVQKCFAGPLMQDRIVVLVTHRVGLVHHLATQFIEISEGNVNTPENPFLTNGTNQRVEQLSNLETAEVETNKQKPEDETTSPSKFIEEEHRAEGGTKAKVWLTFIMAAKYWWILLGIMMSLTRVFEVLQQWFYKSWGEAYGKSKPNFGGIIHIQDQNYDGWMRVSKSNAFKTSLSFDFSDYLPSPTENLTPWLILLLTVSIAQSFSLLAYGISQLTAVYATSKNLFALALKHITLASFRFYDVTPTGRLMNRLTSDISVLDSALTYFGHTIFGASGWVSSFLVIAFISPLFLLLAATLMALFVSIFFHFLPTSRSLKRLETVSLSPLFTRFGELLQSQGLTTVRAFYAQQPFEESTISIVDQLQSKTHFYWSVQNWLMWRYENISAISTFMLTAIALAIDLSPGLTAFMLTNASTLIGTTHMLCLRFGDLQTEFISVERIVELLEIDKEPPGTNVPRASWPRFGADITLSNVTVRYAPELDPSLIDISLRIPGGSMTAIIGRTGSGKSTLAAALLNIVRAETGVITIDDVSLADIDVNTLRRRVTFIPQDPVLFDGTIHNNLDPIGEHTESECETVLSSIGTSTGQYWKLSDRVESGGRNFSQGQRQLLGITRAVLRRSPIIILDEATASIDIETAMALQQIIRTEMSGATVITIAHRVEAVKNADYVIELEGGRVKRQERLETFLED